MPRTDGWIKQKPDPRDYHIEHPEVAKFFKNLADPATLPDSVNLYATYLNDFPDIYDQGNLGSCTANAGKFLTDFCEHRAHQQFLDGSRLFLYWNSRIEDGSPTEMDTGATIRSTLKALADYGICFKKDWPYDTSKFAIRPTNSDFDEAKNFRAINYVLIDRLGMGPAEILTGIMQQIASGLPVQFGSNVYEQIMNVGPDGRIAMPRSGESSIGGHSMAIVGYDKNFVNLDGSKGAFLIRNSWGDTWGIGGYGWLPFGYILTGEASDFWVLVSEGWINPSPPTPDPTPTPTPPAPSPISLYAFAVCVGLLILLSVLIWIFK